MKFKKGDLVLVSYFNELKGKNWYEGKIIWVKPRKIKIFIPNYSSTFSKTVIVNPRHVISKDEPFVVNFLD